MSMHPKPLSKSLVLQAMSKTGSNRAAARYLGVSFPHYKRYAKLYVDEESGQTLWEKHKNQSGTGIPKFLRNSGKNVALLDILEGRVPISHFTPEKIKSRMLEEGYLKDECNICKFHERRLIDYKVPLLLHYKDGNKTNFSLNNVQLLCYNCYFLTVGDIFTKKDIEKIEDYVDRPFHTTENSDWQLDEYQLERLSELGLDGPPVNLEDGSEFISRL